MTSIEKAKEIIKQGGNCNRLICESGSATACPCADIGCKESHWPEMITICEEFLERQNMQPVTSVPFNIQDLTENVNALLAIKSEEASKLPLYSEHDPVNHPSHYTMGKVECVDAIASATTGLIGMEAFCTGQIIKYSWRWKYKNGKEDLEKARFYLDKLIIELSVGK